MGFALLFGRMLLALRGAVPRLGALAPHDAARRAAWRGVGAPDRTRLEVLGRKSFSRTASVAIVRVGDRDLVVGVTPQSVTLISEIQTPEPEPAGGELLVDTPWKAESRQTPMAWDATISKLRELTVRR